MHMAYCGLNAQIQVQNKRTYMSQRIKQSVQKNNSMIKNCQDGNI